MSLAKSASATSVPGPFVFGNIRSGLLVFLIALPLCLAIGKASGCPPVAGVFTAIVGGILTSFISNSQLTIKGPAAGLIVIVAGCVTEMQSIAPPGADELAGYRMMLAVGFAAAIIQIGIALFRLGILGEFFPSAVVHGMLAAIGIIIISKQTTNLMGVVPPHAMEPLESLAYIPTAILNLNPEIALIGAVSLLILFGMPMIPGKRIRRIPVHMVVIVVTVLLGWYFDLGHEHTYSFLGHNYSLSENFLVAIPTTLLGAIKTPDFSALQNVVAWKWVFLFSIIGTLESLLSAKAVDLLDPLRRKTSLDRDILAVGVANLAAASIGGLPMISEIVRSKANIDNGAASKWANMWHAVFMLIFVVTVPQLIHQIPNAALAAMLIYTGCRLASPREFVHVYHIGREQLTVFCATLIGVIAIDLLAGVAIGIAVKIVIHLWNGVPLKSLFRPYLTVEEKGADTYIIHAGDSAVFTNWIPFRRTIEDLAFSHRKNVIIDFSKTKLVDHSVMAKLSEMQFDFEQDGLTLELVGLDSHQPFTSHQQSARRRGLTRLQRLTLIGPASLQDDLEREILGLGIRGFTSTFCRASGSTEPSSHCRIEILVPPTVCSKLVDELMRDVIREFEVSICVETVYVAGHIPATGDTATSLIGNSSASH